MITLKEIDEMLERALKAADSVEKIGFGVVDFEIRQRQMRDLEDAQMRICTARELLRDYCFEKKAGET